MRNFRFSGPSFGAVLARAAAAGVPGWLCNAIFDAAGDGVRLVNGSGFFWALSSSSDGVRLSVSVVRGVTI